MEKLKCEACGQWGVPSGPGRVCPNCTAPFPEVAVSDLPVETEPLPSEMPSVLPPTPPDVDPLALADVQPMVTRDAENLVPCKFCGEKIQPKARKCRHCGEFQSDADRALQNKSNSVNEADTNLTGGEIALGLLCSNIACIVAIVWMIQGKKKGGKLLLLVLVSQLIMGVLSVLVRR